MRYQLIIIHLTGFASLLMACQADLKCGPLEVDLVRRRCVCPNGSTYRDGLCYGDGSVVPLDGMVLDAGLAADAGSVTTDACEPRELYRDDDGDGFGDSTRAVATCVTSDGLVELGGDCDDDCPRCFPGSTEACDSELRDEDCDGIANEDCACVDGGREACGMTDEGACELGERQCVEGRYADCVGAVGPADETCNGRDDDCDARIDEAGATVVYFRDRDGDGFGNTSEAMTFCTQPLGWATRGGDCVDTNPQVFPGQTYFFADPIAGAVRPFDYDCDGMQVSEIDRAVSDRSRCAPECVCWLGAEPSCGQIGTTTCSGAAGCGVCVIPPPGGEPQAVKRCR